MKRESKLSFFICATEQSGDNIGEKILFRLKNRNKNKLIFDGVGGDKLSPFFNKKFYSIQKFKSIGVFELFGSIKKYLNMINLLSNKIIKNKYNFVITIDSPDFNYRLAKKIKEKGFEGKLIHIVAPTVWAWRASRAKDFSKVYDKLFVIFPFEKKLFQKYNLDTTFIGNPIFYIKDCKNINRKKYIVFLPGSREGEINSLINYFNIITNYLDSISSNFDIFIPTLKHLKKNLIKLTKNWKKKPFIETNKHIIEKKYQQSALAVVCSGTASLEIVKRKIPQLVIYKLNFLTEMFLKFFVKIKYANIINIMSNKMIIKEVTNSNLNNRTIIIAFKALLHDYESLKNYQSINSKKYLKKLILKNSPDEIVSMKIEQLFFPKPIKN